MTEQTTEHKLTVGEMGIEEFFALFLQIVDRRREGGDPKLLELSVKEFSTLMLEQLKSRAYATAQAETSVAEQILTDWKGLQEVGAVSQPFRITTLEELKSFLANTAESFDVVSKSKSSLVIAVAIVNPHAGTYVRVGG